MEDQGGALGKQTKPFNFRWDFKENKRRRAKYNRSNSMEVVLFRPLSRKASFEVEVRMFIATFRGSFFWATLAPLLAAASGKAPVGYEVIANQSSIIPAGAR